MNILTSMNKMTKTE